MPRTKMENKEKLPNKKYKIIYADPPWNFETYSEKGRTKTPDRHYSLMKIQEIKNIKINKIADKDCVLFLWVPWYYLQGALEVMKSWGFKYSCCGFNWIKRNKKLNDLFLGLGKWTRNNSEVCLLGIKGNPLKYKKNHSVHEVIISRIERHSKKPDEARRRIDKMFGNLPKIELFARERWEGWDVWGDEAPNGIQKRIK